MLSTTPRFAALSRLGSRIPDWLPEELHDSVGIDRRALAAFRIALGALVLGDIVIRARRLDTFYTDAGVLPRSAAMESMSIAVPSIHAVSGDLWFQVLLFVLAGILATCLVIGYRSKLMVGSLFVLQVSVYARNPLVVHGGDALLLIALFLAIFLPLSGRWSVETPKASVPKRVTSLATVTILTQLVIVYTANVFFKLQSELWRDGRAVWNVLELEHFAVAVAPYLTDFPAVLIVLNWVWVGVLASSVLLVLAADRVRIAVVGAFIVFHLGMLLTMRLGLFPLIVIAYLLLYLPERTWNWVEGQLGRFELPAPRSRSPTPHISGSLRRLTTGIGRTVLVLFLITSLVWPAAALGAPVPDPMSETDNYPMQLFAPNPPTESQWHLMSATLEDRTVVNAFDGELFEETSTTARGNRSILWQRYLGDIRWGSDALHDGLGSYLCDRAANSVDEPIANVTVYQYREPTTAAGGGEARQITVLERACPS